MFLTEAELVELTGYARPSAQIKFLRELPEPIRFIVNGAGHVVIARAWIDSKPAGENVVSLADRPNLAAIRKRA